MGTVDWAKKARRAEQAGYTEASDILKKREADITSLMAGGKTEAMDYYNKASGLLNPYQQVGLDAMGQIQQMLSGGYNYQASPMLQQQIGALSRIMASKGLNLNSQAMAGAMSPLVAADYNNQFTRLNSLMGTGMGATGTIADILMNQGNLGYRNAGDIGNIMNTFGENQANLKVQAGTTLGKAYAGQGTDWGKIGGLALGAGMMFLNPAAGATMMASSAMSNNQQQQTPQYSGWMPSLSENQNLYGNRLFN
jgi:hypothetical protein